MDCENVVLNALVRGMPVLVATQPRYPREVRCLSCSSDKSMRGTLLRHGHGRKKVCLSFRSMHREFQLLDVDSVFLACVGPCPLQLCTAYIDSNSTSSLSCWQISWCDFVQLADLHNHDKYSATWQHDRFILVRDGLTGFRNALIGGLFCVLNHCLIPMTPCLREVLSNSAYEIFCFPSRHVRDHLPCRIQLGQVVWSTRSIACSL